MKFFACIKDYLLRRKQAAELLSMDRRMLKDIGLSRADAEYFAGRFRRNKDRIGIWKYRNER